MNLQTISEHTVDMDLLSDGQNVIMDLGCRDFHFTRFFRERGDVVLAVDADKLEGSDSYHQMAITDFEGRVGLKRNGEGTYIRHGDEVECTTLEKYLELFTSPIDVLKLDCEGSEKEIIMSLTKPPARQISIEFHLHTGSYSLPEVALMVAKLHSLGYKTIQHVFDRRHGLGENAWDSLFVLE